MRGRYPAFVLFLCLQPFTGKQVEWLLEGLEIEQKKAHHEVKIKAENVCF